MSEGTTTVGYAVNGSTFVNHGAGLGKYSFSSLSAFQSDFGTSSSHTYTIYTAKKAADGIAYSRLHYLEESMAGFIRELAAVNPQSTVTLVTFDKEVETCTTADLNSAGVNTLINKVGNIATSGGTRQDYALKHVMDGNAGTGVDNVAHSGGHLDASRQNTVILITDGAPVAGTGWQTTYSDGSNVNSTNVYERTRGQADRIKAFTDTGGKATLATIGLGVNDVDGGKTLLQSIASTEEGKTWSFIPEDSSEISEILINRVFNQLMQRTITPLQADVSDPISDTFYPIARVGSGANLDGHTVVSTDTDGTRWIQLKENDWIDLEGNYLCNGSFDDVKNRLPTKSVTSVTSTGGTETKTFYACGQIQGNDTDGYSVDWSNQQIDKATDGVSYGWHGTIYLKAKEDFIGGNVIKTNKGDTAAIVLEGDESNQVTLESPSVNVHLLKMDQFSDDITIILGNSVDAAEKQAALTAFYNKVNITELVDQNGATWDYADSNGTDNASFLLNSLSGNGALTADDLTALYQSALSNGTASVSKNYTYNEADGTAGYFTYRLTKAGATSSYGESTPDRACYKNNVQTEADHYAECDDPVETYTLTVTYTAYQPGSSTNAAGGNAIERGYIRHTGTWESSSPGTLVTNQMRSTNVHRIHVRTAIIDVQKLWKGEGGINTPNNMPDSVTMKLTYRYQLDESSAPGPETYAVTANITNGSCSNIGSITESTAYHGTISANEGYLLPDTITVQVSGTTLGTNNYTYDSETGQVNIPGVEVTGNISITGVCSVKPTAEATTHVTIQGEYITSTWTGSTLYGTQTIWEGDVKSGTGFTFYSFTGDATQGSLSYGVTSGSAALTVSGWGDPLGWGSVHTEYFQASGISGDAVVMTIRLSTWELPKNWKFGFTDGPTYVTTTLSVKTAASASSSGTTAAMTSLSPVTSAKTGGGDTGGEWITGTYEFTLTPGEDWHRQITAFDLNLPNNAVNVELLTVEETDIHFADGEPDGYEGFDFTVGDLTQDDNGTWFAKPTNTERHTYALPDTGGIGTKPYVIGGLLLMVGSLLYSYRMRRKRGRGDRNTSCQ